MLVPLRRLLNPQRVVTTINQYRFYGGIKDYGTADEFTDRWTKFFSEEAYDRFELHRGLNNCFSYDIVPPVPILEAALKAARRLNDPATATRIFGALRDKTDTVKQYEAYLECLEPLMNELGVVTPEQIGRNEY